MGANRAFGQTRASTQCVGRGFGLEGLCWNNRIGHDTCFPYINQWYQANVGLSSITSRHGNRNKPEIDISQQFQKTVVQLLEHFKNKLKQKGTE